MISYVINDLRIRAKTALMEIEINCTKKCAGAASEGDVRLVNGYPLNEGRFEIYHN